MAENENLQFDIDLNKPENTPVKSRFARVDVSELNYMDSTDAVESVGPMDGGRTGKAYHGKAVVSGAAAYERNADYGRQLMAIEQMPEQTMEDVIRKASCVQFWMDRMQAREIRIRYQWSHYKNGITDLAERYLADEHVSDEDIEYLEKCRDKEISDSQQSGSSVDKETIAKKYQAQIDAAKARQNAIKEKYSLDDSVTEGMYQYACGDALTQHKPGNSQSMKASDAYKILCDFHQRTDVDGGEAWHQFNVDCPLSGFSPVYEKNAEGQYVPAKLKYPDKTYTVSMKGIDPAAVSYVPDDERAVDEAKYWEEFNTLGVDNPVVSKKYFANHPEIYEDLCHELDGCITDIDGSDPKMQHFSGYLGEVYTDDGSTAHKNQKVEFDFNPKEFQPVWVTIPSDVVKESGQTHRQNCQLAFVYVGKETDGSKIKIPEGMTDISFTFANNQTLKSMPKIPDSVTTAVGAFRNCSNLRYATEDLNNIASATSMFANCENLKYGPAVINVNDANYMFAGDRSLENTPVLGKNIVTADGMFWDCESISEKPKISEETISAKNMTTGCTKIDQQESNAYLQAQHERENMERYGLGQGLFSRYAALMFEMTALYYAKLNSPQNSVDNLFGAFLYAAWMQHTNSFPRTLVGFFRENAGYVNDKGELLTVRNGHEEVFRDPRTGRAMHRDLTQSVYGLLADMWEKSHHTTREDWQRRKNALALDPRAEADEESMDTWTRKGKDDADSRIFLDDISSSKDLLADQRAEFYNRMDAIKSEYLYKVQMGTLTERDSKRMSDEMVQILVDCGSYWSGTNESECMIDEPHYDENGKLTTRKSEVQKHRDGFVYDVLSRATDMMVELQTTPYTSLDRDGNEVCPKVHRFMNARAVQRSKNFLEQVFPQLDPDTVTSRKEVAQKLKDFDTLLVEPIKESEKSYDSIIRKHVDYQMDQRTYKDLQDRVNHVDMSRAEATCPGDEESVRDVYADIGEEFAAQGDMGED